MATSEEKIIELEKQAVILKTEIDNQKEKHEKLHEQHKHHKKTSQYLHIITPFLGMFAGLLINWLKERMGKDKLSQILEQAKSVCSKCKEHVDKDN